MNKMKTNRKFMVMSMIATAALACVFVVMAGERSIASSDTIAALEVIDRGLDWDEKTPISIEQQTDRMNANVDVLASQTSERNRWAVLAGVMMLASGASFAMFRKVD